MATRTRSSPTARLDRVHDLALRITRDDAAAGDVAQDAFLSAWRGLATLEQPGSFGGWLLRITRNRAFNDRRDAARSQPVDGDTMAMMEQSRPEDRVEQMDEPAQLAADSEVAALVWESVEALGARDAEVLDLTLRCGMTPAEVAVVVGTNRNAANQIVHRARLRLRDAITARVLWRGGTPACGDLADELHAAGITRFDTDAVRLATAHADTCAVCSERRRLRLEPAALFGAVPVIGAPVLLKQRVAHALSAAGVPMGGAARGGGGTDAPRRPRPRRARHVVLAGAALVAVVLAVIGSVVLADSLDDRASSPRSSRSETSVPVSTPSLRPAPTTRPPIPIAPSATTVQELVAPPVETPAPPPTPPPTPPPAVTVQIAVAPASASATYLRPSAPVLRWSTNGAPGSLEVSGPGMSSVDVTGSTVVCPTASTPTWSVCVNPAGTVTYVITARAADGSLLATASATLTIA